MEVNNTDKYDYNNINKRNFSCHSTNKMIPQTGTTKLKKTSNKSCWNLFKNILIYIYVYV